MKSSERLEQLLKTGIEVKMVKTNLKADLKMLQIAHYDDGPTEYLKKSTSENFNRFLMRDILLKERVFDPHEFKNIKVDAHYIYGMSQGVVKFLLPSTSYLDKKIIDYEIFQDYRCVPIGSLFQEKTALYLENCGVKSVSDMFFLLEAGMSYFFAVRKIFPEALRKLNEKGVFERTQTLMLLKNKVFNS